MRVLGLALLGLAALSPRTVSAQALDHYTLLMAFLPGQCLANPDLKLCDGLTLKDPAARNLTLIGLRPDAHAASIPLRDCDPMGAAFSTPIMDGSVVEPGQEACALPALTIDGTLREALDSVMPSTKQCADRRFWSRYGACSMLSQEMYFQRAVDRAKDMQKTLLNVIIGSNIGQRVKRDVIVDAFAQQFGADNVPALQLVCGRAKKRLLSILTEVHVTFNQLGTMKPLAKEGLWMETGAGARHRCPEEFLIPEAGQPIPDPVAKPLPPGALPVPSAPVVPQPSVPQIVVPEVTAPEQPDPTKPQPMETEPMQVIPPLSE